MLLEQNYDDQLRERQNQDSGEDLQDTRENILSEETSRGERQSNEENLIGIRKRRKRKS